MGLRWNVPLPGPLSVGGNVGGGKRTSAAEDIETLRVQRAIGDLRCPAHLRTANRVGWAMLAVTGVIAVAIVGPWALPVWGVLGALTWGRHQFRHQRRAPHLARLATGSGCDLCQQTAAKAARRRELNPLAHLDDER